MLLQHVANSCVAGFVALVGDPLCDLAVSQPLTGLGSGCVVCVKNRLVPGRELASTGPPLLLQHAANSCVAGFVALVGDPLCDLASEVNR